MSTPTLEGGAARSARDSGRRSATLAAGARLGPYEIVSRVGVGGMGEVYRARDARLQRDVAIKVLPPEFAGDRDRLSRFEREARAASGLFDPHIVPVLDIGREGDIFYFVSEFVEGSTLGGEIAAGRLSLPRSLDLAEQIASGLAAAHEQGIVHRDLKPENVLISKSGTAKIADFGLAKLVERPGFGSGSEGRSEADTAPAGTAAGVIMGTIGYMAPEQVQGGAADARTDIFAFGCVLYEMLTGGPAFPGESPMARMAAILRDEPPIPSSANPEVPSDLDKVVLRCLEKVPGKRFQSSRDLAFALRSLLVETPPARPAKRRSKTKFETLAILPFENTSAKPDLEYLSDGITEGLIGFLSQVPRLAVIARATVFRYKGKTDIDPRQVGRDLDVDAVLTGSVTPHDGTLSIQAELVDTARGFRLWGDGYSRPALDILAVQEDIAREIWTRLRRSVSPQQKKRFDRRHTSNREAHDLYLKGLYQWNVGTAAGLRGAVGLFEQAIEKDPDYALAWASMADCYTWLGTDRFGGMPPREAYPKAKSAAKRALELDPALGESHAALALASFFNWEWEAVDIEFRTAIRLNPDYSTAHHSYGVALMMIERFEESSSELRRALAVDPLSPFILSDLGWSYYCARRYESAIYYLRNALEVDPRFVAGMIWLGLAYSACDRPAEALPVLEDALRLTHRAPLALSSFSQAFMKLGRMEDVEAIDRELEDRSAREYVSFGARAIVKIALGDRDQAFEWLARAVDYGASFLGGLRVYPFFDPLREDPRFPTLVDAVFGGKRTASGGPRSRDEGRSAP